MYLRAKSGLESCSASVQAGINVPHSHDVLCGRGGAFKNHEGNKMYRQIVESNRKLYGSVPKEHKRLLARSIVETIQNEQSPPGRFIEKGNDGLWYELRFEAAVEKTKQSLREARGACQGAKSRKGKKRGLVESNKVLNIPEADRRKRQKSEEQTEFTAAEQQRAQFAKHSAEDYLREPAALPMLARISSTLGSIMKRGPFLPSLPFDDETERRILAEYDVPDESSSKSLDGRSTTVKGHPNAPPSLETQFSLTLSLENTQLLSQISRAISFACGKGRTSEQSTRQQPSAVGTSSHAQGMPLSPEETRLLSRISTLTLAANSQERGGKPADRGSEQQLAQQGAPTLAAQNTLSLSAEETQLLSQISVLFSGNIINSLGPTERQNDRVLSLGGLSLSDLLASAGAKEGDSSIDTMRLSSAANPIASDAVASMMIPPSSSQVDCDDSDSCCGSLLEDDDLDTAAGARLRTL